MTIQLSKQASTESNRHMRTESKDGYHSNTALAVSHHETAPVHMYEETQMTHPTTHTATTHYDSMTQSGAVVHSQTTVGHVGHSGYQSGGQSGYQSGYSAGHSYGNGNHGHGHSTSIVSHGAAHGSGRIISTVTGEARQTGQAHVIATRTGGKRYTGETRIVETVAAGSHQIDTRVVGVERGAERQVSVTEVAMGEEIIGQHTVQTGKGRRGRKVIREEVIEKVIIVPETVQIEEWVEDEYDMEETVIEVAKKIQIEKVVEVPEIEIVEKIIEQVEKVIKEKIVEVATIQTVERIVEVPVIQTVERIVEVPEIQYRDVPVEKIVDVPDIQTEEVIREVKKAQFVDKPIEQKKLIIEEKRGDLKLPVPVEAETIVEFTVPHLRANYIKKKFPVYLPRFIEVPVSRQFVDADVASKTEKYSARLANLISVKPAVSLCEIEGLASEMKMFFDEHNMHNATAQIGGALSESSKRGLFARQTANLEQLAPYRHLPVEVGEVLVGHHHLVNRTHSTAITYSSTTFGLQRSGSLRTHGAIAHSSTGYLPTSHASLTTSGVSTAYKAGHAVGSAVGAIRYS